MKVKNNEALQLLQQELSRRRGKDSRYSIRAYARALSIHPATLSVLLKGKRPLTAGTAKRLLDQLKLDPATQSRVLYALMGGDFPVEVDERFTTLERETFDAISGWEHFAILSLLETRRPKSQGGTVWIASRLGIHVDVALDALQRLERLRMVEKTGVRWVATGQQFTVKSGIPNSALRKVNRQYIEKALGAIERVAYEDCDISGITLATSRAKLAEAKLLIKEFRRSLCAFLESGAKEEVFRLNVQLFPLER